VYDEFVDELVDRAEAIDIGPGRSTTRWGRRSAPTN